MPYEYFPSEAGKRQLDALILRIKKDGKGQAYYCLVGVFGGLDSSYVVYLGSHLNYINYRMDTALANFFECCGYTYCGGKHYESVLTRFLLCYYLPTYFDFDKRKSHFSSLIVTSQMTRDDALLRLVEADYTSDVMREADFHKLAVFIDMTDDEFAEKLEQPKHKHMDYSASILNSLLPVARKFRKDLG
jgi:hypothetical protein